MYWSPNFLAVVFKKQEISQQVVTKMQDLASEFSKKLRGWYHRTLTVGGGDPLPHPTPSSAFGVGASVLGPKPWSPLTFQPWLRHC